MNKTICGASALLLALTACAAEEGSGERSSTETASYLAALEVNEDGSDVEVADATGAEPRLLRGCSVHAVRDQLRRDFDRDGDGQLTGEEEADLEQDFTGPHRRERRMRFELVRDSYDTDGDGSLDDAERSALDADLAARCEQRLADLVERFDGDGSGALDESEWAAAHAEIRARFAENHAQLVARFDADDSGDLDESERRRAREAIADELHGRRERADLDGSGHLEPGERDALRAHFAGRGPRPIGHGDFDGGRPLGPRGECDGGLPPPPDGFAPPADDSGRPGAPPGDEPRRPDGFDFADAGAPRGFGR